MKMIAQTIILLGIARATAPDAMSQVQPRMVEVNGVAASVNGRVITKNQLAVLMAPEVRSMSERFPNRGAEFERALAEVSKKLLAELIEREKTIQDAKPLGIRIADQQVEARITREIAEHYVGNRDEFRNFLRSQRTTIEAFRDYMHDELLEDAILRRQGKKK